MPKTLILIAILLITWVIINRRAKLATLKTYALSHGWRILPTQDVLESLRYFLPTQKAKPFFACEKSLENLPATLSVYHFLYRRARHNREFWGSLLHLKLPTPSPTFQLLGPWSAWPSNILHRSNLTPVPLVNFSHGKYQLSIADHHSLEVSQLFSASLIEKLATLPYGLVIEARNSDLFFGSDRFFMTTKDIEDLQAVASMFLQELLPKLPTLSRNISLMNDLKKV